MNFDKFLRTPIFAEHLRWLLLQISIAFLLIRKKTIVNILVDRNKNRKVLQVQTGCCLELLIPAIQSLLGNIEKNITKDINGEDISKYGVAHMFFLFTVKTNQMIIFLILMFRWCSVKKVVLEISQTAQEKTCAKVSLLSLVNLSNQ